MSTRRRMRSDNRGNARGTGMKNVVIRNIDRADAAVIKRLGVLGTAAVHEAYGRGGLMKPYLCPVWAGGETAGRRAPRPGESRGQLFLSFRGVQCPRGQLLGVLRQCR